MATLAPKTTATEQSSMCLPPFQIGSPSRGSRPLVTAKQAARLAKKRARDRRSQQAMRCRNRSELESLRLQVVELSEQLQLSTCALENKTLRQENNHLRRQLDDIQYILRRSRTPIPSCTIAFDSAILERWWSKRSIVRSPSSMNGSPPAPTTTLTAPRDTVTDSDTSGLSTPIWLPCRSMPSPHVPPTCPSDRILQRFIEEQKRALQTQSDGTPPSPSVAHIMATLLDTYMEIDNLPKKVACLYVLSTVVNWLILQTQEAFELMPVWMRPVAAQIQIPHPAWIDRIIWPSVRDYLVRHQDITFDKYTFAYTLSFSIAWPYPDDHILLPAEKDDTQLTISPLFIEYIRNLSNWVVGPRMCQHYPDMGKAADRDRRHFGN